MVKEKFLQEISRYNCLQGNDIRLLLYCLGRDVFPKHAAEELGWKRQNVSNTAKKLEKLGLMTITDYPVTYRTNEKWKCPDIPGQLELKV